MHKLCNVQKTCLPEAVYLVDFEDRELRVSEFNIHLFFEPPHEHVILAPGHCASPHVSATLLDRYSPRGYSSGASRELVIECPLVLHHHRQEPKPA